MQSPHVPRKQRAAVCHEIKGKAFFVDLNTFGSLLHHVAALEHLNSPCVLLGTEYSAQLLLCAHYARSSLLMLRRVSLGCVGCPGICFIPRQGLSFCSLASVS